MIKKLTRTGNSAALVLDKQLLEAANLDPDGQVGPKPVTPGQLPRALVQLRRMHGAKFGNPGQYTCRPAQSQIGAPYVWPVAHHCDASGYNPGAGKPGLVCFGQQRLL